MKICLGASIESVTVRSSVRPMKTLSALTSPIQPDVPTVIAKGTSNLEDFQRPGPSGPLTNGRGARGGGETLLGAGAGEVGTSLNRDRLGGLISHSAPAEVFSKLGISSRRELADALPTPRPELVPV